MEYNTKMFRLPLEAYTSKEWFDKERDKIFGDTWQFAGFTDDLKEYGDHICLDTGKLHIIVTKDKDGSINALHSACRHRGNRIDTVTGDNKKMLKCPYHYWSYDLKGNLLGAPQIKQLEPFDKEDYSLKKASVAIWKTLVFVHPDPNAEPFEKWIHGVEEYMGPHQPNLLEEYYDKNNLYIVNCNWKIFAENYMDGYHLEYLHEKTLFMYDHKRQTNHLVNQHWTFFEPLAEEYQKNLKMYDYEPIDHIPSNKLGAYVHLIFPNLGIAESESTWSIMQIIPMSPNKTMLRYRTKVMPKSAKYGRKNKDKPVEPILLSHYPDPMASYDFMIEDMYVCENIQKQMESGTYDVGPMHMTLESALTNFQQAVLDKMK